MRIGIAGAGAIAMGYAAFLIKRGHEPGVWSPSGSRTEGLGRGAALTVTGAIEGTFHPRVSENIAEVAENPVIVIAMPANGHRQVFDQLAAHIKPHHLVIISSHLSFAAHYLEGLLAVRGIRIPIVVWNTTLLTSKEQSALEVKIGTIRSRIDMAVVPAGLEEVALKTCTALFDERFDIKDDVLTIALSNLNPQSHMAIALCNLTRMERGETWGQRSNITPAVGRLLEGLDRERIAVAAAFGKPVRTIFDHYARSFGISADSIGEIAAKLVGQGKDPAGPKTLDTRYVLEDVPYGLVQNVILARMAGAPVPLHQGGIDILGACYGRDFERENDLTDGFASAFELARSKGYLLSPD